MGFSVNYQQKAYYELKNIFQKLRKTYTVRFVDIFCMHAKRGGQSRIAEIIMRSAGFRQEIFRIR